MVNGEEFIRFLNTLAEAGILHPHSVLCVSDSFHTMYVKDERYYAKTPHKPITFVSPLGALAYCRWRGGTLPSLEIYDYLAGLITDEIIDTLEKNYKENEGGLTVPGKYAHYLEYFDIVGNAREIALNISGKPMVVGGSYRDEPEDLSLTKHCPIPILYREGDIGFRIQLSTTGITEKKLFTLIAQPVPPEILFENLLNLDMGVCS
jgi:hypothetical protein